MSVPNNVALAIKFLRNHVRGGLIFLMAMLPLGGVPLARTFRSDEEDELREFLEPLLGKRNIYFSANPIKRPRKQKPSKGDMASMSCLYVDIDLRSGADREPERERILERISTFKPRPTTLISSGNGYQAIWHLGQPMLNDGDYDRLEAPNKQLEAHLGADACYNIDRILRVPATLNLTNKKKRDLGYKKVMSELVWQEDRSVRMDDFELLPEPAVELLRADGKLKDRWLGDDTGLKDSSRSGFDLSLVAMLKGQGLSYDDTENVLRQFPHGRSFTLNTPTWPTTSTASPKRSDSLSRVTFWATPIPPPKPAHAPIPRKSLCYKAEPVGLEPTSPLGRRFSRPVQYQLCDGSKTSQSKSGRPDLSSGRLRRSSLVSAVDCWAAMRITVSRLG